MVLLAPTAPLITIGHDWSSPVERVTSFPSRVLAKDDGSEQRLSLSHLATERVTYRLLPPKALDVIVLITLADLATDTLVRVPRWEDQTRLAAAAAIGDDTLTCDTTDRETFVAGAQVIVWRSASEYEVGVIAGVTSGAVTLEDPLATAWAPGAIIAPIAEGRLALPFGLHHWRPTSGALTLAVDLNLRDLAGVGGGGAGAVGEPAAISVAGTTVGSGGRSYVVATVTDAAGNILSGLPLVWTSGSPTNMPIWPTGDPHVAIVGNPNTPGFVSYGATATLGAITGVGTVYMGT